MNDDSKEISAQPEGSMQGDAEALSEALYADTPTPQPIRPGRFHSYALLNSTIDSYKPAFWETLQKGPAALEQRKALFADIHERTGLDEVKTMTIANFALADEVAGGRFVENADQAVMEEERQTAAWTSESMADLRATYGPNAEAMLARVKKFARSHSGLSRILQHRGLGSRPEVVRAIAEHVFSTGYR